MRVDRPESRAFYEIEALKNNWSARENDAVVRYTLGPNQQNKIFASRYKLHLPTEAELQAEIRREMSQLQPDFRA
jgi:predicted nuclease of restriction endonuclease-like (RecB) superfamily